jgi:methyl halide transferase
MSQDRPTDARSRLLEHFDLTKTGPSQNERWSQLWDQDWLPWDKGFPNPALEDLLLRRGKPIDSSTTDPFRQTNSFGAFWTYDQTPDPSEGSRASVRRKRALVPGCGRGYDVLLLASFGYDAYGLDISKTAIQKCREYAANDGMKYTARDEGVGKGTINFIQGDFFGTEWQSDIQGDETFDIIYDYTVRHYQSVLQLKDIIFHGRVLG